MEKPRENCILVIEKDIASEKYWTFEYELRSLSKSTDEEIEDFKKHYNVFFENNRFRDNLTGCVFHRVLKDSKEWSWR